MGGNITFSIIVIGFNIEDFLERCLNSVFAQNYDDYEVIFVNDGSTDNTLNVAQKYIDKRIKIVDKANGGIISARKAGLEIADGLYIAFVDGDDSIKSDALSSYAKYISESNDFDIVISDLYEEKDKDNWILKTNHLDYGMIDQKLFLEGIMDGTIYHYMCSKIYRKSFLIKSGYYDFSNLTVAEDLYTNAILAVNQPKILYIDYAGYNYHNNSLSLTRDGKKSLVDDQLLTLDKLKEYFVEHFGNQYDFYISYQWYLFAYGYIQTRYSYNFKIYLIDKCKPYMNGVKNNPLYKQQKVNLSRIYGRFLLTLYSYFPLIAKFVDPFSKIIIDSLPIKF